MRSKPPLAAGRQPVIGHTRALLDAPLDALLQWGHTDDPLVRIRIPGRELYLVTDPGPTKQVLSADSTDYRKAEIVRERLGTLQGGSLVLRDGEQWQQRRETLQPAFARGRVAAMGSVTTTQTAAMIEHWPTETPIPIVQEIQDLVLGILADALFGLELGDENPIEAAADDILARMDLGSVSAYLPEWVPTPTNLRFRRAVGTLHDRLDRVVDQQRRAESEHSLLSIMLAAGLPPEAIRDELIALLFAGYDSTATALSCTLALIGSHPAVQSELCTELDAVLGGQPPTPEDLSELSVLDAILKESLRLYPPQYILFREPTATVQLGGYRVESGTTLVLSPWVLQRDAQFWDDPAAFRPERWLNGGAATADERPAYAYIPYGGGPRHCLGSGLADQTLRLVVAAICQRRQLQSTESLSVSAGPTLSVTDKLTLHTESIE